MLLVQVICSIKIVVPECQTYEWMDEHGRALVADNVSLEYCKNYSSQFNIFSHHC